MYNGFDGKKISWKKIDRGDFEPNGYVDLVKLIGPYEMAVAYAWVALEAVMGCHVKLLLGSDDGIAVWLNGKQILCHEAERNADKDQNSADLFLKHGRNELLLKIDNKRGTWGYYARFAEPSSSVRLTLL